MITRLILTFLMGSPALAQQANVIHSATEGCGESYSFSDDEIPGYIAWKNLLVLHELGLVPPPAEKIRSPLISAHGPIPQMLYQAAPQLLAIPAPLPQSITDMTGSSYAQEDWYERRY
ncbi:MAG: hypothetical protein O2857_27345 [Planctomycetota bacterium]|nr:hypothetical protein [Planctomycetota bacterium]